MIRLKAHRGCKLVASSQRRLSLVPLFTFRSNCFRIGRAQQFPRERRKNRRGQTKAPTWTTQDVNALRSQGLISIVGTETEACASPCRLQVRPPQVPFPVLQQPLPRILPGTPSRRLSLQAELDARQAALARAREESGASDSWTHGKRKPRRRIVWGVTPEERYQEPGRSKSERNAETRWMTSPISLAQRTSLPGSLRGAAA